MGVQSLGWEDPLEEDTATHCSILAWRIPWTEEPGGLQSMGLQMSDTTERLRHSRVDTAAETPAPPPLGQGQASQSLSFPICTMDESTATS